MEFLKGEKDTAQEIYGEEKKMVKPAKDWKKDIKIEYYLKAAYPLLFIRTEEDDRAVGEVRRAIANTPVLTGEVTFGEWKSTTGLLIDRDDQEPEEVAKDIAAALKYVQNFGEDKPPIVCFHNIRGWLSNPTVIQQLKDTALVAKEIGATVILIGAQFDIPPELNSLVTVYDLPLPTMDQFTESFKGLAKEHKEIIVEKLSKAQLAELALSAVGMTYLQGENAGALSIAMERKLLPEIVQLEKEQAIKRSDVLEFIHASETMEELGGFTVLKKWISKRSDTFTPEARKYGVKPIKGLLFTGVAGTGKSLAVKCIANFLRIPLLKLDIGRIFTSLVGSSEARVRAALKTAEAVAPAVLWIEEIEKSMAGSQSSGNTDSGTTARVMSTILTWMQENVAPVIILATANNVEALPPELLRKGRFSEIWGVTEPGSEEREQIWKIHIKKVRPNRLTEFDYDILVKESKGYTGAEIEGIVEEAMFDAWDDKRREMTTDDLVKAMNCIIPQSITSKEKIDMIKKWMKTKVRFVSDQSNTEPTRDTDKKWRKVRADMIE